MENPWALESDWLGLVQIPMASAILGSLTSQSQNFLIHKIQPLSHKVIGVTNIL